VVHSVDEALYGPEGNVCDRLNEPPPSTHSGGRLVDVLCTKPALHISGERTQELGDLPGVLVDDIGGAFVKRGDQRGVDRRRCPPLPGQHGREGIALAQLRPNRHDRNLRSSPRILGDERRHDSGRLFDDLREPAVGHAVEDVGHDALESRLPDEKDGLQVVCRKLRVDLINPLDRARFVHEAAVKDNQ
jgi:hypothetical protein